MHALAGPTPAIVDPLDPLAGLDPFLDDLSGAVPIEARALRAMLRDPALTRAVYLTFPALPEVIPATLAPCVPAQAGDVPTLRILPTGAPLDTRTWCRGIAVNLCFFDGPDFIGCRTRLAGGLANGLLAVEPHQGYRFARPAVASGPVLLPPSVVVSARLGLPGEKQWTFRVRVLALDTARGEIGAGPSHRPGVTLGPALLQLDGRSHAFAARLRALEPTQNRRRAIDVALDGSPAATAALRRVIGRIPRAPAGEAA